jgi:hypothetical protein
VISFEFFVVCFFTTKGHEVHTKEHEGFKQNDNNMKVVKHLSKKVRKPGPEEQMRKAIMDVYREAQFGHRVETDNRLLMRSARFIGAAASRIHRFFATTLVRVILAIAALYLLIHWTGISISFAHNANLLFTIK